MGTNTDAILLYGFAWDEENEPPWLSWDDENYEELNELDFEDYLLQRHNFQLSDDPWPDWYQLRQETFGVGEEERVPSGRYQEKEALFAKWRQENKERLDKRYKEKEAFLKSLHQGVVLDTHCSGSCPMYYIAIEEAGATANRGCPVEFEPEEFQIPEETRDAWDERLRAFCENAGIEPPEKFSWVLVSYWSS